MVKIGFIIDSLPGPTAGTEKQLILMIRNLDRQKFDPILIVLRPSTWINENPDFCEIVNLNIHSLWNPINYWKIWNFGRSLSKSGVSILMTYFRDSTIIGVLSGLVAWRVAVICNRRNQGYWMNKREYLIQRIINFRIDLFLTNSISTKNLLMRTESISPNMIKVIYNFIDSEFSRTPSDVRNIIRKQLTITDDEIAVINISNLRSVKGLDTFLLAAEIVCRKHFKVSFHIFGEGPDRVRLEEMARTLGISDKVNFHGFHPDASRLLPGFDLAVLSSNSESFSNSLVEYTVAGLPIITTEVGGSHETVEEGVNGWIVPTGDPNVLSDRITAAIDEPISITTNKKFIQKFTLKNNLDLFESIFSYIAFHRKIFRRLVFYQNKLSFVQVLMCASFIKRTLVLALACFLNWSRILDLAELVFAKNSIRILNYHMINPEKNILGLSVNPETFESQLRLLNQKFKIISLSEAVTKIRENKVDGRYVVLTFDDGYSDNYTYAYPILKRHGIPATVFIVTDAVNKGRLTLYDMDNAILNSQLSHIYLEEDGVGILSLNNQQEKKIAIRTLHILLKTLDRDKMERLAQKVIEQCTSRATLKRYILSTDQIQTLDREGLVELGSHSMSHSILSRLTAEKLYSEIRGSKEALDALINNPVLHFSYPNGKKIDYSEVVMDAVRESGFLSACTTIAGLNLGNENLLELKRIDITPNSSAGLMNRFSQSLFYYRILRLPLKDYSGKLL